MNTVSVDIQIFVISFSYLLHNMGPLTIYIFQMSKIKNILGVKTDQKNIGF